MLLLLRNPSQVASNQLIKFYPACLTGAAPCPSLMPFPALLPREILLLFTCVAQYFCGVALFSWEALKHSKKANHHHHRHWTIPSFFLLRIRSRFASVRGWQLSVSSCPIQSQILTGYKDNSHCSASCNHLLILWLRCIAMHHDTCTAHNPCTYVFHFWF